MVDHTRESAISVVGFDLWRHRNTVHWSKECPAYRRAGNPAGHWDWASAQPRWIIEECFLRESEPLHQCRKCWPAEMIVGTS